MSQRFEKLELAYAALPDPVGNPCGTCQACCRAGGRASHQVSELELRYLERRVGPQHQFRAYLAQERRHDGSLRFEVCPHYGDGCTIYAHRPWSCRTFGRYREMGGTLPDGCVYEGRSQVVSRRGAERSIPGAAAMRELLQEWRSEQVSGAAAVGDLRAVGDPLDVALKCSRRGDVEGTLAALEKALTAYARAPLVLVNAGLLYATVGKSELALEVFAEACQAMPGAADPHYYAGTQAQVLDEPQLAMAYLERALELDPDHFRTQGLLGSLYCKAERWEDALRVLEPACERPDLHGVNHFYLEMARRGRG